MDTKTCNKCDETKSVSEFGKDKKNRDGLRYYCRPCHNESVKQRKDAYRSSNQLLSPEQIRANTPSKRCSKCKNVLPSSEFGIDRGTKPGLSDNCYDCNATRAQDYRERNPDYGRKHYEANPEIYRRASTKRRALKHEAFVEDVLLEELVERDGSYCVWCGGDSESWHIDHVVPLTKDGLHCLDNLAVSCAPCNLSKHNKMPALFIARRTRLGLPVKMTPHVQQLIADVEAGRNLDLYQKIDGEIRHPRYVHESTHAAVAA